jgi:hypothetical protein
LQVIIGPKIEKEKGEKEEGIKWRWGGLGLEQGIG